MTVIISRREIREKVFARCHGQIPPNWDMSAARNDEKASVYNWENWLQRYRDEINQTIDMVVARIREEHPDIEVAWD